MPWPKGRKYSAPRPREVYRKIALAQQKPLPDAPELSRLYFGEGLSMRELGARFGVSATTISTRLRFHGIAAKPVRSDGRHLWTPDSSPRRPRGPYTGKSTWIRLVFQVEGRPRICSRCQSTRTIQVHHIDEDRGNNASANLEVLCKSCHRKHHGSSRFLPKDGGWPGRRVPIS